MVTIAVLSQKGGVGKTVTVTNLGVCLAERGQRVLMVDFDPQADLSASWGLEDDEPHPRVEQYLGVANGDVGSALFEIPLGDDGRLALLPTVYEALRGQTARLLDPANRDLKELLERLRGRFDVVLIDTPAGDTVFGRQAMAAADEAIVPMLPGYHELRALTRVLDLLDARAQDAAGEVGLLGVLLVNADQRWRSTREYGAHLATLAREQEIEFFHVIVPRHQPVTEHARYGRPTALLRPRSTVAIAYRELAREVLERLIARPARVRPARQMLAVQP
jgi:chromosome partitioning protein